MPGNLESLHHRVAIAVVERNLGMPAMAAAGVELGTLNTVAMTATRGILGTISSLPEMVGTLETTVAAEMVQHTLPPSTATIVATNNHHLRMQLMAVNTIIAAVNILHNHIQLSSAERMVWEAQRAPCGLAFQRIQTRGCALLHS